jgi:hypothetical protein
VGIALLLDSHLGLGEQGVEGLFLGGLRGISVGVLGHSAGRKWGRPAPLQEAVERFLFSLIGMQVRRKTSVKVSLK